MLRWLVPKSKDHNAADAKSRKRQKKKLQCGRAYVGNHLKEAKIRIYACLSAYTRKTLQRLAYKVRQAAYNLLPDLFIRQAGHNSQVCPDNQTGTSVFSSCPNLPLQGPWLLEPVLDSDFYDLSHKESLKT